MKIDFKKYSFEKPLLPRPEAGDICLCECGAVCEEGVIAATYTEKGFVSSIYGYIDKFVTGYITLDL